MVDQFAGGQAPQDMAQQAAQGAEGQSGSVLDAVKNVFKS